MEILERMPFTARKAVFDRLEQMASKANMSAEERLQYETEWKISNDYYNTLDSSKREGREEGIKIGHEKGRKEGIGIGRAEGIGIGRKEEKFSMARSLKDLGVPFQTIAQASGLSLEEIAKL